MGCVCRGGGLGGGYSCRGQPREGQQASRLGGGGGAPGLGARGTSRSEVSGLQEGPGVPVGAWGARPPAGSPWDGLRLFRGPQNSVLTIFASESSGRPVGLRYKYRFIYSVSQSSTLLRNMRLPCGLAQDVGNGDPGVGLPGGSESLLLEPLGLLPPGHPTGVPLQKVKQSQFSGRSDLPPLPPCGGASAVICPLTMPRFTPGNQPSPTSAPQVVPDLPLTPLCGHGTQIWPKRTQQAPGLSAWFKNGHIVWL